MLSLSCADPLVTFSTSVRTVTFGLCLNSVKVNQQAKDQRSFNSVTVRIQAHTYWTHFALPEPPKWPVKINAAQTQNTSQYQYFSLTATCIKGMHTLSFIYTINLPPDSVMLDGT